MKTILVLLALTFSFQGHSALCGDSTYEEVEACTVEDKFQYLFSALYPSHSVTSEISYHEPDPCDPDTADDPDTVEIEICEVWDQQTNKYYYEKQEYDDLEQPELTTYERLVMLNKPNLSVFEAELNIWKTQAKVLIDWRVRVDSVTRFRRAMTKCGYSNPNIAKFKESLVLNDPKLTCLESKKAELDAEDLQAAAKAQRHKDISFGVDLIENILLLIPGTMDPADKLSLLDYLAKIERLLRLGDIDGAKGLVEITPVTPLFSAQLQGYLVLKMSAYLGD